MNRIRMHSAPPMLEAPTPFESLRAMAATL
jgi:hypothetical protein